MRTQLRKLHRMLPTAIVIAGLAAPRPGLAADAAAATAAPAGSPRIGLALSGGGARGIAHIGVLKVLEEMRVPIHCVTGTSMGAIVGGTFAAGLTPMELEKAVLKADWNEIFRDQPPRDEIAVKRKIDDYKTLFKPEFGVKDGGLALPKGVIAGVSIESFFRVLTTPAYDIEDFNKLPIPFRAMATDIETGQSVVLDRGSIAQAMRASMSVPGALAPVEIDGRLLVDGGIANNLPIDEARRLCGDVIIAVNISTPPLKRSEITSALSVAGQLVNFLGLQTVQDQLKSLTSRDVLIAPDLGDISAAKFDRSADAIRIGEEATRKLADSLQRYSLPPEQYAALRSKQVAEPRPLGTVDEIRFAGLERTNPEVLRALVETKPGEQLSEEKLGHDLRRVFGRGDFESIGYRIGGAPGPRALIIEPKEKSWGPDYLRFGLGLASDFQGDNAFNALVEYRRTWLNHLGGEWTTQAQIGQNTYLATEFYQPVEASGTWFVSPYASIGQQTRGVFAGDDKVADYLVKSAQVGIAGGAVLGTWGQFGIGPVWTHVKASIDTGSKALPEGSENTSGIRARLFVDQTDHAWWPTNGIGRNGFRLRGVDFIRVGTELPAARRQLPGRAQLGRAHDPGRGFRGHGSRLGHAGLRILHARRAPAPVRLPDQPVRGPGIRLRPADVLQADLPAAGPPGVGGLCRSIGRSRAHRQSFRQPPVAGNALVRIAVPGRRHLRRAALPGRRRGGRGELEHLHAARRAVAGHLPARGTPTFRPGLRAACPSCRISRPAADTQSPASRPRRLPRRSSARRCSRTPRRPD